MIYNKTKIVATIGPASSSYEVLKNMILAGVDVCRLNLSHGEYSLHKNIMNTIRTINAELNTTVSILVDLQGPKIRIGEVENNSIHIAQGSEVILSTKESVGNAKRLFINYADFAKDVVAGDKVLIDDGKFVLTVKSTNKKDEVIATADSGGTLSSRKGVNLPNTKLSLPSLTEKDLRDLEFAMEQNVNWIGLSFVRRASDIIDLRKRIADAGKNCRVIAKIEKPEALEEIED